MKLMNLKEIGEIVGRSYKMMHQITKRKNLKPAVRRKTEAGLMVNYYDPTPFFEYYGVTAPMDFEGAIQHDEAQVIEEAFQNIESQGEPEAENIETDNETQDEIQYDASEQYPPLPVLTPELIYALKDVLGPVSASNVLAHNYGLAV